MIAKPIAAVWITNSRGQILLAQRGHDRPHDAGIWGPAVSGKVDPTDATPRAAALREAREELRLILDPVDDGFEQDIELPHRTIHVFWFGKVLDLAAEDINFCSPEVAAVRWVNPDDFRAELQAHPDRFMKGAAFYYGIVIEWWAKHQAK